MLYVSAKGALDMLIGSRTSEAMRATGSWWSKPDGSWCFILGLDGTRIGSLIGAVGKKVDYNSSLGKVPLLTRRADLSCHAKLLSAKVPTSNTWSIDQRPQKLSIEQRAASVRKNTLKRIESRTAHRSERADTEDHITPSELTILVQHQVMPAQALYCAAVATLVPIDTEPSITRWSNQARYIHSERPLLQHTRAPEAHWGKPASMRLSRGVASPPDRLLAMSVTRKNIDECILRF